MIKAEEMALTVSQAEPANYPTIVDLPSFLHLPTQLFLAVDPAFLQSQVHTTLDAVWAFTALSGRWR
jgi:hypothetical protein